jgi:phage FluMu protein Com
MSQAITRCPYCVLGGDFRPMSARSGKSFVCASCGHVSFPQDPHLRCSCPRCLAMNRLASRIGRDRPEVAATNS